MVSSRCSYYPGRARIVYFFPCRGYARSVTLSVRILAHVVLPALLGLACGSFGCREGEADDDVGDDDTTDLDDDVVDDDTTMADDDSAGDDDAVPVEGGRIGVAFGDEEFRGQAFAEHLDALNVRRIHINIWWWEFERQPGAYDYSLLDAFLQELDEDVVPLIRITARGTDWAMDPDTNHTVPRDLSIGGDYYEFVHEVVDRTAGRVALLENDWEVDEACNWEGTAGQYAEMMRTFHRAATDANPDAVVVCGGSYADDDVEDQLFFAELFEEFDLDGEELPFDRFDLHLYQEPHLYPEMVGAMRQTMEQFPETAGIPIIATEYGGPTAPEYRGRDPDLYDQLIAELRDDITLLAGDLTSTPLQPDGYPDYLRMFAFGVEPELDDKRDRIQARQAVQRAVVGMAEGVEALYWWSLDCEQVDESIALGIYFRHLTYGKLCLALADPDPGGDGIAPLPNYDSYANMAGWLADTVTATRIEACDPTVWLYEILRGDGSTIYVIWHQRDSFDGEDEPPFEVTFEVPWTAVATTDVFGEGVDVSFTPPMVTMEITDTPVFVLGFESP